MKKELRRAGSQINYAQRNTLQGTQYRETYNSHRKQYQEMSSGYYMYSANAVARDYSYEEEPQRQVHKKTVVKRRPVLAQHISTLLVVFLLGMSLVVQYAYIQNLGFEVSQTKTELKTVQEENEKMKKQIAAGEKPSIDLYFAGKNAIADFVKDMDLVLTVCDVSSGRPVFGLSRGGGEIPWYVFEVPVVVVVVGQPTMLADLPQARTYINTYDSKDFTLDAFVDQLMTGPEAFKGQDPIDSYCGLFDSHL